MVWNQLSYYVLLAIFFALGVVVGMGTERAHWLRAARLKHYRVFLDTRYFVSEVKESEGPETPTTRGS